MSAPRWHRFRRDAEGAPRYVDLARVMAWDPNYAGDGGVILRLESGSDIWIANTEQEVKEALGVGGEDLRPYSERLLAMFKETDAKTGINAVDTAAITRAAGAMKDLLISMGMEWSEEKGDYVFP